MTLRPYFCDRRWRRLIRCCIGLWLGWLIMIGLGAWTHLDHNPPLEILPTADLPSPSMPQPLNGLWEFLPDAAADTTLTPTSPELPALDWSNSQPITVPANWYLEDYDISGVAWYRHRFSIDEDLRNQDLTLTFEGIDYAADVWLNGQYLGFHEGYFQSFQFFVSDIARIGQDNELIVRVNSPLENAPQDWSLHKRLIKGVLSHHDARPGGAWSDRGQEKNTGGIWAPVTLRASHTVVINQVKVTPQVMTDTERAIAKVEISMTVPDQQSQSVQIKAQLLPANFEGSSGNVFGTTRMLTPGKNAVTLEIPQPQPQLWWTWDHGSPNLYKVRLQILDSDRLLDAWETRFGFRTVEWDDRAQIFRLNGHRIFLRGTNYIPSQWLSELTPNRIQHDIDVMKEAHINSVRVHAHITTPVFYHQADEAGLLIWQDFPLQWGYQDTQVFTTEAICQGRDMIAQLYNHPSIFAWSLHNEPPWDAFWMVDKYPTYHPNQNLRLDKQLYRELRSDDRTRYLHAASIIAEHPWWGWYSFTYGRYGEPTDQPLITEFGAQALPNDTSLAHIFDPDELWPETETDWAKWQYHNFQPHETFEIAQVDMGSSLDEFISNTQQYQAQLHQYAAESYRRQRYRPVSAMFQFMFCEPWPSINWGMVDYWRDPKAGYFALQQAYQPILPSIEAPVGPYVAGQTVQIKLWAINDTWESLSDVTLRYVLKQGEETLETAMIPFSLWADDLKLLTHLKVTPDSPGEYALIATIQDNQNHLISQNHYTFNVVSHN